MTGQQPTEHGFRWRLTGASICWAVIAFANFEITDLRWLSGLTGLFALACGICTFTLALWPTTAAAYRCGGTLAVGALTLRTASLVWREVDYGGSDYPWVALAQIGISVMLAMLYAWWWLTDVKTWHLAHRQAGR